MAVVLVVQNHQGEIVVVEHRVDQPGIPEWKNVESPIKEITFLSVALENPQPVPTDEPMQMRKSPVDRGGRNPRV